MGWRGFLWFAIRNRTFPGELLSDEREGEYAPRRWAEACFKSYSFLQQDHSTALRLTSDEAGAPHCGNIDFKASQMWPVDYAGSYRQSRGIRQG